MARILIGNIKGPKGDTGARGATGPTGPVGPQGPLPPLINNALATQAGISALDAVMGKTLQDQITQQNRDILSRLLISLGGSWDGAHSADDYRSTTTIIWCHPSLGTLTEHKFPTNTTGLFISISYSDFAIQFYATTGGNIWYRGTNISSAFPAWTNLSL